MVADVVRHAFDAFTRRDLDAFLETLDPDVRLRSLMTEAEQAEYHGYDGVRAWYAAVFDVFPDWSPSLRELREEGEAALGCFDVFATAASSGVRIAQGYHFAAHVRDGRLDYFGFFRSEEDARQAVGLEGPE
jgi:ketosteroid isomerase-like protein